MISAGLEGRLPYMTYPEPWRGPPKQPPEFLRPAPKPVPPRFNGSKTIADPPSVFLPSSRFNGVSTTAPNGTRLVPSQRTISKYPPSPPSISAPVNLTQQHKDEVSEELAYSPYRLYSLPTSPYQHFPTFTTMYHQSAYSHMIRPNFPTAPLPPMEAYSPTTPTAISSSTFLSPSAPFSPSKPTTIVREKRTPPSPAFKVPSGKEGSMKHRILTRPEDVRNSTPLDLQKSEPRKRLNATMSPPRSPKKSLNNNIFPGNFAKGSLIQLANGELRRIEDMRTEDFVTSADRSPELRLADSTVVRIEESNTTGTATITLSYNQRRTQVEVESTVDHPYFVFGQGWASCNPEKTQHCYGLKVHRLQVGDILISLTPREQFTSSTSSLSTRSTTIMTTATTTAMTARSINSAAVDKMCNQQPINLQTSHHPPQSLSPDSLAARRRRWSAPDQICDEEEQMKKRRTD